MQEGGEERWLHLALNVFWALLVASGRPVLDFSRHQLYLWVWDEVLPPFF